MATLNQRGVSLGMHMVVILITGLAPEAGWCRARDQETPKEKLVTNLFQAKPPKVAPHTELEKQVAEEFRKSPEKFVKQIMAQYQRDKEKIRDAGLSGLFWFVGVVDIILSPNSQLARAELVKYLELDKEGNLKVTAFPKDDAELAYYLLWLLDTGNVPPRHPYQGYLGFQIPYQAKVPYICFWDAAESYRPIVQSYGDKVPPALVEYLFMLSPVCAWYSLADEKTRLTKEDFTWTVHVLATTAWRMSNRREKFAELDLVRKELQKLADDTAWYSRRFVVQVLLRYPFFRTPELVKKLQNDPHPLVRERAKHIKLDPAQQK